MMMPVRLLTPRPRPEPITRLGFALPSKEINDLSTVFFFFFFFFFFLGEPPALVVLIIAFLDPELNPRVGTDRFPQALIDCPRTVWQR